MGPDASLPGTSMTKYYPLEMAGVISFPFSPPLLPRTGRKRWILKQHPSVGDVVFFPDTSLPSLPNVHSKTLTAAWMQ